MLDRIEPEESIRDQAITGLNAWMKKNIQELRRLDLSDPDILEHLVARDGYPVLMVSAAKSLLLLAKACAARRDFGESTVEQIIMGLGWAIQDAASEADMAGARRRSN